MGGKFRLSKKAAADIRRLALDSLRDFGDLQTDVYMQGLDATFETIAANPGIGTQFVHSRTGKTYRRLRYVSHVVYYRERSQDVFIVRVLHTHMLPTKHL